MSEAGDYSPAPHWGGHDFVSAKRAYRSVADRSLSDAVINKVAGMDCVPKKGLKTDSEAPLVIAIDVTGSMDEWPVTIFSKLPYLEHEGQEYLGKTMEISFAAIGDAHSDAYPLQIREFVKGPKLKEELQKLIHEGKGGGSSEESYDLAALYYARNCEMPEALRKPIFIFIGDEGIYSRMSSRFDEWCCTTADKDFTARQAFEELKKKFSVYVVRKPYHDSGDVMTGRNKAIHEQWCEFIGEDHVVMLPEAARVVDVIFGILAKETGRIKYFEAELKDRQGKDADGKDKIAVVMKSLHTVHALPSPSKVAGPKGGGASKSVSLAKDKSKAKGSKSISLLDDDDK